MKVLLIILLIFFLIAIIPLGVSVKYSEEGLFLSLHAAFIKIGILPPKESTAKPKKKRPKKKKEKPKPTETAEESKPEEEKKTGMDLHPTPGGLVRLIEGVIEALKRTLDRLRRKITVNYLVIRYTSASRDPYDAAMNYGRATAAIEAVMPGFERWLRVKKSDYSTSVSFDGEGDRVFIDTKLTLRIWEIIYIALGMLPAVKAFLAFMKESKGGKAEENGQASHK